MPKYNCSYGYDVPHYFDLTVEAANETEAKAKLEKALADGVFTETTGQPCWENMAGERVFVSGPMRETEAGEPTLDALIEQHQNQS